MMVKEARRNGKGKRRCVKQKPLRKRELNGESLVGIR
jgi:hypothetical protein